MSFVLDHVFILVREGAPEADALVQAGFVEGSRNTHAGMGTANRRFFFENAMLELLYVRDPVEAQSEPIKPAGIWERSRFRESGASPFALVIRPTVADAAPPFETWDWTPPFLPPGAVLRAARTSSFAEPFVFLARGGPREHPFPDDKPEPTEHPSGARRVSGLRVTYRQAAPPSEPLRALERLGISTFVDGEAPLLELTLDGARAEAERDFRPRMPLLLRW